MFSISIYLKDASKFNIPPQIIKDAQCESRSISDELTFHSKTWYPQIILFHQKNTTQESDRSIVKKKLKASDSTGLQQAI